MSSNLLGEKTSGRKGKKNWHSSKTGGQDLDVLWCVKAASIAVSPVFGWTYFCEASFSAMTAMKAALDFQIPVSPKYQAKIKKKKQPIAFSLVQRCYQWQCPWSESKSSLFLIAQSSKKYLKTVYLYVLCTTFLFWMPHNDCDISVQ